MEVVWPEKVYYISETICPKTDHMRGVKDLMSGGKYADIKLTCKNKESDCHKFILAAQSPVFQFLT